MNPFCLNDDPHRFTAALLLAVVLMLGCDRKIEHFRPNQVYALTLDTSRGVDTQRAVNDVSQTIETLFGTPEEPRWPANRIKDGKASRMIDESVIKRAAGPVYSDREGTNFGLFNKHCVNCHGVEGSGRGPASVFQNPYPRDFRRGLFKWKHTLRNAKPTRDGIASIIHQGIPGTAMPSFALLEESDWTALTDYAIFLSIRGETERRLMAACVDDDMLAYDGDDVQLPLDQSPESINQILNSVVQSWVAAESSVVPVPPETNNDRDSVERGKGLFHGQVANCVGCHGQAGNGNVVILDFDDWTKEYSTQLGLTPTDREAMKPFRDAGAHRPKQLTPRKLDDGVFRGGGESATLYRRIGQGIAGTPMPSIQITDAESTTGLTSNQVWDLVHYVQSLGPSADQAPSSGKDE